MKTRTINVTDGAVEYVTARVDETFDMPIDTLDFYVGLGTSTNPPEVWRSADYFQTEDGDASVVYVSMLVDDSITPRTRARLWVKMVDAPETLVRLVNGVDLTIV